MIIGPLSGSPSAWSWFSQRVEKVGVAPLGLGARAVRKRSLECHGFRRTASLRTTSNRTTSLRTTSARKISGLELIETVSLKQPGSENNLSENNFSPTARTNCEDEPRISSLRTPSPSSLRARTCTSQKGFSTNCAKKGFCCASSTVWGLSVLVYPSTNQAQGEYTRSITEHDSLAKSVDSHFRVAGPQIQFVTNETIHMCYIHHTH